MLGLGCGRLISERFQKTLMMACAVAVIFLGLTGAVKEMLALDGGGLALVGTNCMLASLIGGALIGEAINIEDLKSGYKDTSLTLAFSLVNSQ